MGNIALNHAPDIIELVVMFISIFWAKKSVKHLRDEVNTLKYDADNFGELLGTERARDRISKQLEKEGYK